MSQSQAERYPLLLYRAVLARLRRPIGFLTVLLAGLWAVTMLEWVRWPLPRHGPWLFAGAIVAAACWLILTIGRRMAYVQPRRDHLRLQTPFLRLKVAYQRIDHTRPVQVAKVFPPTSLSAFEQRLMLPFMGMTVLAIDLHGLPLPAWLLRLFLQRRFLAPDRDGLVLITPDWMRLSEQISDHMEGHRSHEEQAHSAAFSDAARILSANPEDPAEP